jgi:hypothetical protein
MLEAELIAFGLSPRQVKIYLALLQFEEGSAREVAEHANLPRLTAYSILEKLCNMGLVSFYEKRHARTYHVNAPEALLKYCDQELHQIQIKRQRVERSLAQLCTFYHHPYPASDHGTHGFRFLKDRTLFHQRCRALLQKSSKGWVMHDGSLWPLLHPLHSGAPNTLRCLIPSSSRHTFPSSTQSLDVRIIPERFWKETINAFILPPHIFFISESSASFLAVEIEHSLMANQVSSLCRMLWQMVAERP